MSSISDNVLDLAEYLQQWDKDIQEQDQHTLLFYTSLLSEKLVEFGVYSEENLAESQEDAEIVLLDKNAVITSNASADNSDQVNEVIEETRHQFDISKQQAFLLIKAPTSLLDEKLEELKMSEEKMRDLQYDEFCEVCPGLADNFNTLKSPATVHTEHQLFDEAHKFVEHVKDERRQNISIIFNGHGDEDGLLVEHKDTKIQTSIYLDKFIAHVGDKCGDKFHTKLRIVFAQCFGHRYNEPKEDYIEVKSFTCDTNVETKNLISSYRIKHIPLQIYATGMKNEINLPADCNSKKSNMAGGVGNLDLGNAVDAISPVLESLTIL